MQYLDKYKLASELPENITLYIKEGLQIIIIKKF